MKHYCVIVGAHGLLVIANQFLLNTAVYGELAFQTSTVNALTK